MPTNEPVKTTEKTSIAQTLGFDAFKLTKERSFLILLIFSALICIPLAFYDSFTNLFILDKGITNAAAAMSLGQVGEVIFLFSFPFFFKKLRYKGSIVAAMLAWIVMYGFFTLGSMSGNTSFLYAVLPLHGFCFTFFFVAGQLYVDEKAPASLRNSAQGFISFATYGVGKYLGTLVAGNVVHKFDLGDTYNWTAVWTVPLLMAIVFTIGFIVLFKEDVQKR